MENIGERASSSNSGQEKPVIVRVKRKSNQSPLTAFWLEINERPWKRAALDFGNLSIGDHCSSSSVLEESQSRKVFLRHVETVSSSETTLDVVHSFLPNDADVVQGKQKSEEHKWTFRRENKQEQLLSRAKQTQEESAKNARFKQIWRSRRAKKEAADDKVVHDMCHFYDVVRLDSEETSNGEQKQEVMSLEDQSLLSGYLPLLRELIPEAAAQIEAEISAYPSNQDDSYVYDYYTMEKFEDKSAEDNPSPFPLIQVEDEDFYDGSDDDSEYDSEDSNAENHPRNDYPDESSEEEDDVGSEATDNESDEEKEDDDEEDDDNEISERISDDAHSQYEDEIYDNYFQDDDGFAYGDDGNDG